MSDAVPAAADSAEQEKEQAKVAEGAKQVKEMSEAMKRLLEPSQRQKGNALKVQSSLLYVYGRVLCVPLTGWLV